MEVCLGGWEVAICCLGGWVVVLWFSLGAATCCVFGLQHEEQQEEKLFPFKDMG